eukprot:CAMPEP_0194782472 /NCGR_PEP_ID=MMETSP0323_2-20130528/78706_1 /TAXON_ID=2866 ORGANISM="Crypthecodinium cohnii, Strain Seligo" /NCGR_SAMPLE_ID=MMETSP0323_2 /ASSEMBLY_ACC=CAM_ASM_000346 /LENGTH=369 /DNA_ID=CAMNT_0039721287 /DNA_START=76 /DNA_END=1186 /DNA_ORIENTATION=-
MGSIKETYTTAVEKNTGIKGKVALVTGGARGIGLAIADRLASDGAALMLVDCNAEQLAEAAAELTKKGAKVVTMVADVTKRDEVAAAIDSAEAQLGSFDIMINNAGIAQVAPTMVADVTKRDEVAAAIDSAEAQLGSFDIMINNAGIAQVAPIAEITEADIDKVHAINVKGVLWGIQLAAAKFKARGHGGKIISACSIAGHEGFPLLGAYCSTKFAVRSLTQVAAKEFASDGITVNAYCPGVVGTDMWVEIDIAGHEGFPLLGAYCSTKFAVRSLTQVAAKEFASDGITVNAYCPGVVGTDMWVEIDSRFAQLTGAKVGATFDKFVNGIALGRPENPTDVAKFVSYLSGPDSDYMTGQCVLIDGGMVYR